MYLQHAYQLHHKETIYHRNGSLGMHNSVALVMPYFSESLGAWAPLPNTSTSRSHHSPLRHGCWSPMCPFRGGLFKQSCIQNKLHSMYYNTCTVKSPTSPTCVSFKLFNVLRVYVLRLNGSLQHLRSVYSFKLQ